MSWSYTYNNKDQHTRVIKDLSLTIDPQQYSYLLYADVKESTGLQLTQFDPKGLLVSSHHHITLDADINQLKPILKTDIQGHIYLLYQTIEHTTKQKQLVISQMDTLGRIQWVQCQPMPIPLLCYPQFDLKDNDHPTIYYVDNSMDCQLFKRTSQDTKSLFDQTTITLNIERPKSNQILITINTHQNIIVLVVQEANLLLCQITSQDSKLWSTIICNHSPQSLHCLEVDEKDYIYLIYTADEKTHLSKVNSDGNIMWDKIYNCEPNKHNLTCSINQFHHINVMYQTTHISHYLKISGHGQLLANNVFNTLQPQSVCAFDSSDYQYICSVTGEQINLTKTICSWYLPPETEIVLADGRRKPIMRIEPNDIVFPHYQVKYICFGEIKEQILLCLSKDCLGKVPDQDLIIGQECPIILQGKECLVRDLIDHQGVRRYSINELKTPYLYHLKFTTTGSYFVHGLEIKTI
jgi:hypothetical protein